MRSKTWVLGFVIPLTIFVAVFIWPLVSLFVESIQLSAALSVVSEPRFQRIILFTLGQAIISTTLTLLLGLPLAFVVGRYRFFGRGFIQLISMVVFVLPSVVVALVFMRLLGEGGWLTPLSFLKGSFWLIIWVHVFFNLGIVIRLGSEFWRDLNEHSIESARSLGAGDGIIFRRILWPRMRSSIATAGLLVFLFTVTSFGVVLFLGGLKYVTIEVEIYRQLTRSLDLPVVLGLVMVQMVITLGIGLLYMGGSSSQQGDSRHVVGANKTLRTLPFSRQIIIVAGIICAGLFLILPLVHLFWEAVHWQGMLSLKNFTALFENREGSHFFISPWEATYNSLRIAGKVVILSVALSLSLLYASFLAKFSNRWTPQILMRIAMLFFVPLGVSSVTLAVALLRAGWLTKTTLLGMDGALVIAHTLIVFPMVLSALLVSFRRLNWRQVEAAMVLGERSSRIFIRIVLPWLKYAFGIGVVFVLLISLGEFSAASILTRPNNITMPVLIGQYLSKPGLLNIGRALSMSVWFVVVCSIGVSTIMHWEGGRRA